MKSFVFLITTFLFLPSLTSTTMTTYEKDTTITSEQKEILEQFREIMMDRLPHDYMKEDIYLIKWLRSRNFDLAQAEAFLDKSLKWRKDTRMDQIQSEDWSDLRRRFIYNLESRNKAGEPLLFLDTGTADIRKSVIQGDGERLVRYVDLMWEEACGLVRDLGHKYKNITRGYAIVNYAGYNLVQHGCIRCIPIILRAVLAFENNYPECASKIVFINTPGMAEPLLTAGKELLTKGTRDALIVFGRNKRLWFDYLLKDFDISEIPVQLGGQKKYSADEYDDYYY